MDQKQIAKQIIELNKTVLDNTFATTVALQDQTEKLVFRFLDKIQWIPEDGKKAINDWVKAYKNRREDFKASADERYKKVADYFAKAGKEKVAKA
jgi:uncharacterized coiled-coil DUF342 family protein